MEDLGFATRVQRENALHFLLDHRASISLFASKPYSVPYQDPTISHQDVLIDRAKAYAELYISRNHSAKTTLRLINFQKFVFVSLCVVILDQGASKARVYDLLRLVLGSSCDEVFLVRVLRAVTHVNGIVDETNCKWEDNRTAELLLICEHVIESLKAIANGSRIGNKSSTYYVPFAEYPKSRAFLCAALANDQYKKGFTPRHQWTHFFIPSLLYYLMSYSIP